MPRLARNSNQSGFFHIMVQGIDKSYIFQTEEQKKEYVKLMIKHKENSGVNVNAYCVMDNHTHMLLFTENVTNISNYMKKLNTSYGVYYNKTNDRVGFVFRNRFQSQYITDESYLINCIKYIHMNPVRAGKVENEARYRYSSYQDYFKRKESYVIDKENLIEIFGEENMRKRIQMATDEIEIMDIEREEENFHIAVKQYLRETKLNLQTIKVDKDKMIELYQYLKGKKYKQIQLARLLNMSPKTLSQKMKR